MQKRQMDEECSISGEENHRSLRNRRSVDYSQFDNSSSDEELDNELLKHDLPLIASLNKGVIRGCADCANCQKVLARWHPEGARRPDLNEAPVFYPKEEEFEDTLKYIESIRLKAEPYGICRIVPPPSWNPPCPLKENAAWKTSKFTTRIQRIDKLQNRHSIKKINLYNSIMRKRRRLNHDKFIKAEKFGFEPGPDFTLESFQKYANDFKEKYFCAEDGASCASISEHHYPRQWEPSVEEIEGEYWHMVENPTEEIEVLYGADLETQDFGSGFPKANLTSTNSVVEEKYVNSGWNLNNLPRLPGSLLSFEKEDISGVLVPWLYIGMCFSSFCWHVEDHHFYSLNYMHFGAPKMWYGVPEKDALLLEAAMKKHLPDLFEEQPALLHNLVTQLSPSLLKLEGVPVYRCVQHSGEFVLTFPRAYHAGFNCGFNCAEAVNVAPIDWLPHGQNAVEIYRDQGRKISVSHDKLLLGAAREAVKAQWHLSFLRKTTSHSLLWKEFCGQDKILVEAVKARIEMERSRRDQLPNCLQSRKMDSNFDANGERECFKCHYDLHLSAIGCSCSDDKFACFNHADRLCSCDWSMRYYLFRYEISELSILIDALGCKLSAVHKWGISDLGLSLSSYVTKPKSQERATEHNLDGKQQEKIIEQKSQNGKQRNPVGRNESIVEPKSLHEKGLQDQECQILVHSTPLSYSVSTTCQLSQENRGCLTPQKTDCLTNNERRTLSSTGEDGSMQIDEHKENPHLIQKRDETLKKCVEESARATSQEDNATSAVYRDQIPCAHDIIAPATSEGDGHVIPTVKYTGHVSCLHSKVERLETEETRAISTKNKSFEKVCSFNAGFHIKNSVNANSSSDIAVKHFCDVAAPKRVDVCNTVDCENRSNSLHTPEGIKAKETGITGNIGPKLPGVARQNSTDGFNQPKGPRMAKVVRRINCPVEPMEFGVVLPGNLWSTNQVIYPKGFRSRVKYLNIQDPSQMCYYVSEILDAGHLGPLFLVQVEQCPSEVFIHFTVTKCWDMVRERVNNEIRRQHSLGKHVVTALQPPGSVDGLEMFGLTSPAIIKEIESIDHHHICSEYWRYRSPSHNMDLPPAAAARNLTGVEEESKYPSSDSVLQGFFKKANTEELQLLRGILTSDGLSSKLKIQQILNEEIEGRRKTDVSL